MIFLERALDDIDYFIEQTQGKITNTKNIIENYRNMENISGESKEIPIKYETERIEEYKLTIEMLDSIKNCLVDDGDDDEIEYGNEDL